MQDIGGLRAVVSTIKKVEALRANYKNSYFEHELVSEKIISINQKTPVIEAFT